MFQDKILISNWSFDREMAGKMYDADPEDAGIGAAVLFHPTHESQDCDE